jgi:hypothetical protein
MASSGTERAAARMGAIVTLVGGVVFLRCVFLPRSIGQFALAQAGAKRPPSCLNIGGWKAYPRGAATVSESSISPVSSNPRLA